MWQIESELRSNRKHVIHPDDASLIDRMHRDIGFCILHDLARDY